MSNLRHFDKIHENDLLVRTDGVAYSSSLIIPERSFSGWHQLVYASHGVITVITPGGSWVVPPLRGVFVPSETLYSLDLHGAVAMKSIFIREKLIRSFKTCFVFNVSPLLKELILFTVEKEFLRKSIPEEKRLLGVILDLLKWAPVESLQIPNIKDERLKRAAEIISSDSDVSGRLKSIAKMGGASLRTIERLVQRESGMSFGKWRQQLRLHKALKLLAEGHTVTHVALEIGYSTPSAFIHSFRQTFGTTPSSYFENQSISSV